MMVGIIRISGGKRCHVPWPARSSDVVMNSSLVISPLAYLSLAIASGSAAPFGFSASSCRFPGASWHMLGICLRSGKSEPSMLWCLHNTPATPLWALHGCGSLTQWQFSRQSHIDRQGPEAGSGRPPFRFRHAASRPAQARIRRAVCRIGHRPDRQPAVLPMPACQMTRPYSFEGGGAKPWPCSMSRAFGISQANCTWTQSGVLQ